MTKVLWVLCLYIPKPSQTDTRYSSVLWKVSMVNNGYWAVQLIQLWRQGTQKGWKVEGTVVISTKRHPDLHPPGPHTTSLGKTTKRAEGVSDAGGVAAASSKWLPNHTVSWWHLKIVHRTITRLEQHRTLIILHSSILLLSWSFFRSACRSQSDSLLLAPSWLSSLGANFWVGTTARHIGQWTEPVKFRRW